MTSVIKQYHIVRRSSRTQMMVRTLKQLGLGLFLVFILATSSLYTRAGAGVGSGGRTGAGSKAGSGGRTAAGGKGKLGGVLGVGSKLGDLLGVGGPQKALAATSSQLNFQARLQSSTGNIVPDGVYSIQFNLYTVSAGGTAEWTETNANVSVKGGYFSVYLGSVTAFPSTINWSADHWITMNVNADGEMTPRIQLSSVPYAFRSGQADSLTNGSTTLTAANIAQLAPSSIQTVNSALTLLQLNQTGTGALAQFQSNTVDVFTVAANGNLVTAGSITASGTYNTNTFTGTGLTFGGASGTLATSTNGDLTLAPNGTGKLVLNTGSGGIITTNATTLQRSAAAFNIDLVNAGLSTLNVGNSNGTNLANLDVSGGIFAGIGNALSINSSGDITSAFTLLDGTSTTNGTSGLTPPSTSLTLVNATNFDVGNYVQVNDTNCGGTGVNPCYAKITAKAGNVLTISPGLTWTSAKTVNEYHVPELGGIDTSQALANRYGRGYFISGVAAGNGTTFYNEDSITTSLTNFDFLTSLAGTLNIGTSAAAINIGNASGTTTIAGNVSFSGNSSAPSTGTSGYLQRSGSTLSPTTGGDNFTTSGNLTTTGAGTITSAAGLTVLAGGLNLTSSGLTNAGALSGITSIGLTGAISGGTTLSLSGAISGGTTLSLSGAITGATTVNTINGLIINSGALSGVSTISASGAITAATTLNTINGLIINSGGLTGITGATFASGVLNLTNGGITNAGSITGVGTNITGTGALTVASGGSSNLTLNSASNIIQIAAANTTLQRVAAGTYNIDLADAVGATTLSVTNSDATQVANLSVEGDVNIGVGKLYKVGGTQISSANLSNDANLAKLDGTGPQTFTGNNKFSGTVLQQTDSLTAFQVQNAAGTSTVLSVDTTNSRVGVGVAAPTSALDVNGALTVRGISAPALSAAGQGRIYYDTVKNKFQSSENGGQFMDLTGFEYLGGKELVSAAATTGAVTIPARDMILIIGRVPSTALPGDIPALRFNGDAGANYWDRHMKSIAGAALFTNVQNASTNMMRVGYDIQTGSRTFMLLIPNRAATSKRSSDLSSLATGSAATVGEITFGGGEWVNTSAQITTVELLSVGGKAMSIDSGFGVFGKNFP